MTLADRIEKGIRVEHDRNVQSDLCTAWMATIQVELESIKHRQEDYEGALERLKFLKEEFSKDAVCN